MSSPGTAQAPGTLHPAQKRSPGTPGTAWRAHKYWTVPSVPCVPSEFFQTLYTRAVVRAHAHP